MDENRPFEIPQPPLEPTSERPWEYDVPNLPHPKGNWIERLLNPRVLQRLMYCGGGLLIVGFVIWLASHGVFDNPRVLATAVGLANLLVLATGVVLVQYTRYQLAGKGLAILGSLALPLNLWLYHAQGLIVLSQGGHLWIPAVICCLIYAAVARVLRDSSFVYALVGGIALTGLLVLADSTVQRIWEILMPATFLVLLGTASIGSKYLFPRVSGVFGQEDFGKAFSRAGHASLVAGLGWLLGGQIVAYGYPYLLFLPHWIERPQLAADWIQQCWAAGISGTGLIVYACRAIQSRHWGDRIATAFTGIWTAAQLMDVLNITLTEPVACLISGLLLLFHQLGGLKIQSSPRPARLDANRWASLRASGLSIWSISLFVRAWLRSEIGLSGSLDWSWILVGVLAVSSAVSATVPGIWRGRRDGFQAAWGLRSAALLGSLALIGAVMTLGYTHPLVSAGIVVSGAGLIPFLAGRISTPRLNAAVRSSSLMPLYLSLLVGLAGCVASRDGFEFEPAGWAAVYALAAVVCGFGLRKSETNEDSILFGVLAATASTQLLFWLGLDWEYALLLSLTSVGFVLVLAARFGSRWIADNSHLEAITEPAGLGLVLTGGIGGVFLALSKLFLDQSSALLLGFLAWQVALTGGLGFLARTFACRQTCRGLAVLSSLGLAGCFVQLADMNGYQKFELLAVAVGFLAWILSQIGVARESGERDQAVTVGLWLGSVLMSLPLMVGLTVYRCGWDQNPAWMWGHEIAALLSGLLLFASGTISRVRATTFFGSITLAVYVLSLLILVPWPQQLQSTSVLMMVCGAAFFAIAFTGIG